MGRGASAADVRERLRTRYESGRGTRILLDGEPIGSLVSYGGRRPNSTVHASRVYGIAKIEVEGSKPSAVLDKVARAIAAEFRRRAALGDPHPAATPRPAAAGEVEAAPVHAPTAPAP